MSVQELARLIDYQLRPGVAASAWLAFTLDDAPGALGQALSLTATAQDTIQRLPPIAIDARSAGAERAGAGEQAQTYETVETISARLEWNAMRPRLFQLQTVSTSASLVVLQGLENNIKRGDVLAVLAPSGQKQLKAVVDVALDTDTNTTRVEFAASATLPPYDPPDDLTKGSVSDFPPGTELDDSAIDAIVERTWTSADLEALAAIQNWPVEALSAAIAKRTARRDQIPDTGFVVFRQRSGTFGHNAPIHGSLPESLRFPQRVAKYKVQNGEVIFDHSTIRSGRIRRRVGEQHARGCRRLGVRRVYLSGVVPRSCQRNLDRARELDRLTGSCDSESPRQRRSRQGRVCDQRHGHEAHRPIQRTARVVQDAHDVALIQSEPLPLDDLPIEDVVSGGPLTLDGPVPRPRRRPARRF